jgi:DnaK suppressor protein
MPLTKAQRQELQQSLEALAAELAGKVPHRIEPNRADGAKVGGDEDEQPLNEMLQAIASNRNKNTDGVLARVNKALAKLRDSPDELGECEECGDDIPFGRLQAMPYAELCVACQGKRDGPRTGPTRKKLTDFR